MLQLGAGVRADAAAGVRVRDPRHHADAAGRSHGPRRHGADAHVPGADVRRRRRALRAGATRRVPGASIARCTGRRPERSSFTELYDGPNAVEPEGVRWSADGMWTNAKGDEPARARQAAVPRRADARVARLLVPVAPAAVRRRRDLGAGRPLPRGLRRLARPRRRTSDYVAWPTEHMQRMESLSEGIQLADENLRERSARFLSDRQRSAARAAAGRARSQTACFHSYLTTDEASW